MAFVINETGHPLTGSDRRRIHRILVKNRKHMSRARMESVGRGRRTMERVAELAECDRRVEMALSPVSPAMGHQWSDRLVVRCRDNDWWVVPVMFPITKTHDLVRI